MTPSVAFHDIEQTADRVLAYALLTRLAKNYVMCVYRLREVANPLEDLLARLPSDTVEKLAHDESESAARLRSRLQELYAVLAGFSKSGEATTLGGVPLPIIPGLVRRIQDRTEDLGNIVVDILLARNEEFRSLIARLALP